MPKNQSTAAKKARAAQKTSGGKHTALLAQHQPATLTLTIDTHLARALEFLGRHTDGTREEIAYKAIVDAAHFLRVDDDEFAANMAHGAAAAPADPWAAGASWVVDPAAQARWDALTPEQQAAEEEMARQQEEAEIMAAERPEGFHGKYYGNEG